MHTLGASRPPRRGVRFRDRPSSAVPSGTVIEVTEKKRETPLASIPGWLATGFGVGLLPVAPGTFGSALGVALFLALLGLPGFLYVPVLLLIVGAGIWAAGVTEQVTGRHDDQRIVIDEIAGQLVTLAPVLLLPSSSMARTAFLVVTGFVLFRVFDIWKPGPVRWAERHWSGGAGIMADDLVAGGLGALLLLGGLGLAWGMGWIDDPTAPLLGTEGTIR
jgi:phosphatidylglycerophosphatase A